jgi:hypothetical protein
VENELQKLGPDELAIAGQVLFGDRWQTELSKALGLSDPRRIRQWLSDKEKSNYRGIPKGIWEDIFKLLEERGEEIRKTLIFLKNRN